MAFSFGTTAAKPAFGTVTTSAPTFGFGTTGTAGTQSTGFGFGQKTTTAGTGFGGFGTTAVTTTSAATGFGGFGGFGGTTSSSFPTLTTSTAATGGGFGGFGTGSALGGASSTLASQQQQQQQQQQQSNSVANMAAAVSMPIIFGDERDAIIAKWNQMQAFWGVGKGYYSQQGAPVAFTPDNPFCRFKAVGYNCLPKSKNEDGLLGIVFKKKHSEVSQVQQAIVDKLGQLMGSKPTLSVHVENTVTLPDDQTELIIYVVERQPTGVSRRIPSTELYAFMNQANIKTQLGQMEVVNILPKTGFTAEQLKFYLDNPPAGIDPLLWQQAKLDNPDPESLIPVPMKGFKELHDRLKFQERQTKLHQSRLDLIGQDITEQQRNLANMVARTEQYKRKHLELGHRVLQVMVRQEIYRKLGYAIQADEEQLRVQLEALQGELNAPTQFKGRLNELMSQIRMQNQLVTSRSEANYQLDTAMQLEIRQHLKQQQEGLQHLISIIKDDMEDLKLIEQGLVVDVKQQKR